MNKELKQRVYEFGLRTLGVLWAEESWSPETLDMLADEASNLALVEEEGEILFRPILDVREELSK